MKSVTKLLIGTFALVATVALAETESTDPTVIARQELMEGIGKNTKILGDMAKGAVPFDAAAAEAAKAVLVANSAEISAKFETNVTDAGSEAKPEIWTNWEDFAAKGMALNAAATALDTASVETVGAGMGAIGGACGACHKPYRM
jgi:cytochrome c556